MEETQIPTGTAFTLTVPLDREKSKTATFYIKEMDEDVYMGAKALIDKGKDFDAVRMIVKALRTGGDDVAVLKGNFIAMQALSNLVLKFMEPVEGEIKKN